MGTATQIGSALYLISSYINHSCSPSAKPVFAEGTNELHLVASKDIAVGEEITVAYVDVSQHADESEEDCRRRRRMELARGWKFACPCIKCTEDIGSEAVASTKDDSKLEESVKRIEQDSGPTTNLQTQTQLDGIDA